MPLTTQPDYPDDALLRLPKVQIFVGLSRTTIYDLIQKDRFPKAIKLSARAVAWRMGDIRQWSSDPQSWRPAPGEPS